MKKLAAVIFFILLICAAAPAAHAENEKFTFGRNEYQIIEEYCTWESAKAMCEEMGGHLAVITSQQEQAFIEKTLNYENRGLWIGAYRADNGDWCWVTGEESGYSKWALGEPYEEEIYCRVILCDGKWVTLEDNAYSQDGFICEWDDVQTECENHIPVTDKAVAATCAKEGKTAGSHCSACGKVLTAQKTVAKLPHSYETKTVRATSKANGSVTKKCTVCGYTASKTTVYKIKSVKLSSTSVIYNGEVRTPSVVVKDSKGNTLKKDTAYTVKYVSGRKNVGTYKVTVTFKGKYSGSKTLTFKINPKGTSVSKITADYQSFTASWKKQTSQTTGYQLQYSTSKSFSSPKTVTVSKNTAVSKKVTGLKSSTKYYVRIRTYKTVDDVKYVSAWSEAKSVTTQKAANIKLNAGSVTLYTGGTKTLKATTVPEGQTVSWKTDDKTVVTVTDGKIKAVGKGKATVTAYFKYKDKTVKTTCAVTVKKPSVSLDKTSATVKVGKSVTLKATCAPSSAQINWKSSNTSVAKVSSSGKVTGVSKGKATVTAYIKYGGKTYKKTCEVTVKAADTPKTRIAQINSYIRKHGDLEYSIEDDIEEYEAYASISDYDDGLMFFIDAGDDEISLNAAVFYEYGDDVAEVYASLYWYDVEMVKLYAEIEPEWYDEYYYYDVELTEPSYIEDLDDAAEYGLSDILYGGFLMWDKILEDEFGFGMDDIGFESFY